MTDTTPVGKLLNRLDHLPPDANRMKLLLDLSHYYWRLGKGRTLDTCLLFAQQAYRQALQLQSLVDSIIRLEKTRQFETLQGQLEFQQRGQVMKMMQLERQKEQEQLRETGLQRNVTIGGTLLLLAFSLLAYRGYLVIHRQHRVQQQLIEEKDKLLKDKDLLMQEIHHRVKNNLNIIISLLESQAAYLKNESARAALQDIQNRIQAIFLLHQKLYRSAACAEVNAAAYILELVSHLSDTFDTGKHPLVITHQLEPLSLDASDLLPLGVILNEAITNAIKHAFPGNRLPGEIHLSLRQLDGGEVDLQIRDNGIGLPAGHRYDEATSLGFTLISGLVSQLHGILTIENNDGVVIDIRFQPKTSLKNSSPDENTPAIYRAKPTNKRHIE